VGRILNYPDVYGIPLPANPRCPKCGTPVGTNVLNGTMKEIYNTANDVRKSLNEEINSLFYGGGKREK
jgi:hypothetical protein